MIKCINAIDIARPAEIVFAFLQEIDNYPLWQIGITEYRASDGMKVGSLLTYTRTSEMGDKVTSTLKITQNKSDVMESVTISGPIKAHNLFLFQRVSDSKTRFQITVDFDVPSLPRQSEMALKFLTDARISSDLARLKSVLEKA